ncbi:uncharacterized protein VTP21DRAFT_6757 [Calcarisporiella thermophila]|uniref:uncharacterized protein n=1 Tax=Calcarisporiella thermophila TaxID=911321 RepID=UPI0037421EC9
MWNIFDTNSDTGSTHSSQWDEFKPSSLPSRIQCSRCNGRNLDRFATSSYMLNIGTDDAGVHENFLSRAITRVRPDSQYLCNDCGFIFSSIDSHSVTGREVELDLMSDESEFGEASERDTIFSLNEEPRSNNFIEMIYRHRSALSENESDASSENSRPCVVSESTEYSHVDNRSIWSWQRRLSSYRDYGSDLLEEHDDTESAIISDANDDGLSGRKNEGTSSLYEHIYSASERDIQNNHYELESLSDAFSTSLEVPGDCDPTFVPQSRCWIECRSCHAHFPYRPHRETYSLFESYSDTMDSISHDSRLLWTQRIPRLRCPACHTLLSSEEMKEIYDRLENSNTTAEPISHPAWDEESTDGDSRRDGEDGEVDPRRGDLETNFRLVHSWMAEAAAEESEDEPREGNGEGEEGFWSRQQFEWETASEFENDEENEESEDDGSVYLASEAANGDNSTGMHAAEQFINILRDIIRSNTASTSEYGFSTMWARNISESAQRLLRIMQMETEQRLQWLRNSYLEEEREEEAESELFENTMQRIRPMIASFARVNRRYRLEERIRQLELQSSRDLNAELVYQTLLENERLAELSDMADSHAQAGDYVWSEEELQDVLNQSMDQASEIRPLPASDRVIKSLAKAEIKKEHVAKEMGCAVCQELYSIGEIGLLLPCNHLFHHSCIVQWLKMSGSCPICRFNLSEIAPLVNSPPIHQPSYS